MVQPLVIIVYRMYPLTAGVFVSSITGPFKMSKPEAIRRALTASQISLRSPKNVPDVLPSVGNIAMNDS